MRKVRPHGRADVEFALSLEVCTSRGVLSQKACSKLDPEIDLRRTSYEPPRAQGHKLRCDRKKETMRLPTRKCVDKASDQEMAFCKNDVDRVW